MREEGRKGMTLVSVKRAPACREWWTVYLKQDRKLEYTNADKFELSAEMAHRACM